MSELILRVTEAGPDELTGVSVYASLCFAFDPDCEVAHAAPVTGSASACHVSWVVPSRWRPLGADFRQQVLNLPFANLLTSVRPDAVRIEMLAGCSLDLPRIAAILGVPCTVVLPTEDQLPEADSRAGAWLRAALDAATSLELPWGAMDSGPYEAFADRAVLSASPTMASFRHHDPNPPQFDYQLYEFCMRDHNLLWRMQEAYVRFFTRCRTVLDVGCGAGVFLGLLESKGICARGVERNPVIARYARELGFDVEECDATVFLDRHLSAFDGIYCSHLVEHLTTEAVDELLGRLARALEPGGRAVLVFPDPESIRSQLLGFWRDPEHVRFYHPDLVELMARANGLTCIWHSHRDGTPRQIVPFHPQPSSDALPELGPYEAPSPPQPDGRGGSGGFLSRALGLFGVAPATRVQSLERELESLRRQMADLGRIAGEIGGVVSAVRADARALWQVNQTWAWEDNAVLVLRKPGLSGDDPE
jgi:SAM-dependent methyltransferase